MTDDPWASYVDKSAEPAGANPWAQYVDSDPKDVEPSAGAPTEPDPTKAASVQPQSLLSQIGTWLNEPIDPKTGWPSDTYKAEWSKDPNAFSRGVLTAEGKIERAKEQAAAGAASGAAQTVTGFGELIPGSIGDKAAEATRALQKIGDPGNQAIGGVLSTLAPIVKGAQLAKGAGEGVLSYGRGLAAGVGTGVLMGAGAPTGKADPDERFDDKLVTTAEGAALGALPTAGSALIKGARELPAAIRSGFGGGAEKAAEGLRGDVASRVRSWVESAQQHAEKLGWSQHDAQAFAQTQARTLVDAEAAADKVIAEQAQRPTMDAREFGGKLQDAAEALYQKGSEARRQAAGFGKAIREAGEDPSVGTQAVRDYIKSVKPKIANEGTKAILDSIARNTRTLVDKGAVEAGVEDSEKGYVAGLSLAKADSLRKTLATAARTKQFALENGQRADAGEAAYYIGKIHGMLANAARKASPEYGAALNKWKEMSRPLDVFESRSGALRGVVGEDTLSGEYLMDKAKVVGAVLNKAKGGSTALARLIGQDPQLKDAARLYFNHELFGFEGAERAPSESVMRTFLKTNEIPLKESGLYDEFSTLKGARDAAKGAVDRAKETIRATEPSAERRVADIAKERESQQAFQHDYETFETQLNAARPAEVPTEAKKIAKNMIDRKIIDQPTYEKMLTDIQGVQDKVGDSEKARHAVWSIVKAVLAGAAGGGAIGGARYLIYRGGH